VSSAAAADFNDSHFHLTNYIQEGLSLPDFLKIMGDRTGRAAVFGIPLQQKWDHFESGDRAPDYYLLSDAELYYYSFTDAMIAEQYLHLPPGDRARIDPMITGFNPTDMYAADHIRRVLLTYPGVFSGIGEFSVHKEFVSSKVAGHTASLLNPALDKLLNFAGEAGLVVILHNDVNTVRPAPGRPAHFDDLKTVFRAHKGTTIIWAHTGLGRFVKPTADHVDLLRELLSSDEFSHVSFDISWDEVAKWIVADEATLQAWAKLLQQYPDRFLFGSDTVAPKSQADYLKAFDVYQKLWDRLDADTAAKVKSRNFERIFDAARIKVRAWEAAHVR
jgi:predicted TIM-barrel fold metal-dependent hydrolase